MPLTRRDDMQPNNSDLFSIRWPMMDGQKQIVLRVSSDTLEDLAAWDNGDPTIGHMELWEIYRDELESFASTKYDTAGKPSELQLIAAEIRSK